MDELESYLSQRSEDFIIANERKPTMADISSDTQWISAYTAKKSAERNSADLLRVDGQCQYYIVKRRRYCSHAAGDGLNGLCSEHYVHTTRSEEPIKNLIQNIVTPNQQFINKGWKLKVNLSRRMKKMSNPEALQHIRIKSCIDFCSIYSAPQLPLFIDVGCAKGRFLFDLCCDKSFNKL